MEESKTKTGWLADFSPRQKKVVTCGITSLAVCAIGLLITLSIIIGSQIVKILAPAITPLVLGILLSFVLNWIFAKIPKGWCRGIAYWGFWLFIAVVIVLGLCLWGNDLLNNQVDRFISIIRRTYDKVGAAIPQIHGWISDVEITDYLKQSVMSFIAGLQKASTWLFAVFFGYCFLEYPVKADKIVDVAKRHLPIPSMSDKTWSFIQNQLKTFIDTMTKYFPIQLGINLFEGVVGAFALWGIGVPSGPILGFLMGFMNIIPLVGTFLMLPVVLAVAYFCDGGSLRLVGCAFGMWAIVEAIDLFLPPRLHGKEMNLPAGVTVFSFLFWGAVIDPIWGMILAIPLTAFAIALLESIKEFFSSETTNKKH